MTDDMLPPDEKNTAVNQRKAIRYISCKRLKAIITIKHLLKSNMYIHVDVINISSKGARVSSKYEFSAKTTITLNLKLRSGKIWKVPATIVQTYNQSEFGIIFDAIQHNLLDQIMEYEI